MGGYLYFESTGNKEVDKLLAKISTAGDCFHHTSQWDEEIYDGNSCLSNINKQAHELAEYIKKLEGMKNE